MARRESVNGPGMEDEEAFVNGMKQLREDKGWTQSDLAKAMADAGWTGIYQTTISRIESGDRPLRVGEARGIARVLGARFSEMMVPWEQMRPIRGLESGVRNVRRQYRQLRVHTSHLIREREDLRSALTDLEKNGITDQAMPAFRQQIVEWMEEAQALLDATGKIEPLDDLRAGRNDGVDS